MFNCPRAIRSLLEVFTALTRSKDYFARRALAAFFFGVTFFFGAVFFVAATVFFAFGLNTFFAPFGADFFDDGFFATCFSRRGSMISTFGPGAGSFAAFARLFASRSAIALPRSAGEF